jgi:hypothetical protein
MTAGAKGEKRTPLQGYETLGMREYVGGGLIMLGVLVSELGSVLWGRWRAREAAP